MTTVTTEYVSVDDIERRYRNLIAEDIAPWADTLRRYVRESAYDDLRSARSQRRDDESEPGTHNTLGNLLRKPYMYGTTLGLYFPAWLREQGQSAPDSTASDEAPEVEIAVAAEEETPPEPEPEPEPEPPIEIGLQTDESIAGLLPEALNAQDPRVRQVWAQIVMALKNDGNADYLTDHYQRLVDQMHAPSPDDLIKTGDLKRVHRHTFTVTVVVETESMEKPKTSQVLNALTELVQGPRESAKPKINYYNRTADWTVPDHMKKEETA